MSDSEKMLDYTPSNFEKVFELLDKKLVSLGVPGALSFVGITRVQQEKWQQAIWCFAGAVAVWMLIKVGKIIAPKLEKVLMFGVNEAERWLLTCWSAARSDCEGVYLQHQVRSCEELTTAGFRPDRTAIPLLEEVFVPLDLGGAISSGVLSQVKDRELHSEYLDIWKLLQRTRHDRKFRKMVILAKGGMGKTTLMRHIALIYGQRKQRRHRAPKLIPVLLRLRNWNEILAQPNPPTLPQLITQHHIPSLSKNHPLTPSKQWSESILAKGKALVLFDGFDEVAVNQRPKVSRWLSAQMQEYGQSVFILTSRPAGYKDYEGQKPTIPLYINKLNEKQQQTFIRKWYDCQERACRGNTRRQRHQAVIEAKKQSDNLIFQLRERKNELGYMAENPLLLNMLVTFHRFDPSQELPQQRIGLYQGICNLQLEDRPKARGIPMELPFEKSKTILQQLALNMVQSNELTISYSNLLDYVENHELVQQEGLNPVDWITQIVEVSELLVERERQEYEFPHVSFQGFLAATQLSQEQNEDIFKANAHLVLQNWTEAIWRETVLLYTAQLSAKRLDWIMRRACEQGSEYAELASVCLKEYPRPSRLDQNLFNQLQQIKQVAQAFKYQALEELLKAEKWHEADQETYRLMSATVEKEEGQLFSLNDLETFSCEELIAIDRLWVIHSHGKFGFSIQKAIWEECGSPMSMGKEWDEFCVRVGWQNRDTTVHTTYTNLDDSQCYRKGEFPVGGDLGLFVGLRGWGLGRGISCLAQRLTVCSKSQS